MIISVRNVERISLYTFRENYSSVGYEARLPGFVFQLVRFLAMCHSYSVPQFTYRLNGEIASAYRIVVRTRYITCLEQCLTYYKYSVSFQLFYHCSLRIFGI